LIYVDSSNCNASNQAHSVNDAAIGPDPRNPVNIAAIHPVCNFAQAGNLVRDGSDDWVLARKGKSFAETVYLNKTGQSATARIVYTSYGAGARPVILMSNGNNGFERGCGGSNGNLVIADLELRAAPGSEYIGGPGSGSGLEWYCGPAYSGKNVLIEGCKFTRMFRGIAFQDGENLVIRRNVVEDMCSRSGSGYSPSPGYVGLTRNILVEENYLLTRAFPTVRVPYQQDNMFYIQDENAGTINVRRNIIASKGNQGPLGIAVRTSANIDDNFMEGMYTGIHVGGQDTPPSGRYPNGTNYRVSGNVIQGLVNMTSAAGGERGIGIQIAYTDTIGTTVSNNIIANKLVRTDGTGLNFDPAHYGPARNVTIQNNILYNANGMQVQAGSHPNATNLRFIGNFVQNPGSASGENALLNPYSTNVGTWSGNTYYSVRTPGTWFEVDYSSRTNQQWQAVESSAIFQQINYAAPSQTLASFAQATGVGSTQDAMIDKFLTQSKDSWDSRFAIDAVLAYFRAGFGR